MTRTLHITIGTRPNHSDIEERLGTLDAGEDVDSHLSRLHIESLATFGRLFRPTNLELLNAIIEHEPASIRELARCVDRHPPEVTENVHELTDYGLIELKDEGRAKRPIVWYDAFEFSGDVPLSGIDTGSDTPISP